MNELSLHDAYLCLDLPLDAPPLQVEKAFRHKRSLYGEGLATYALFDIGARKIHLERLESAYRRILAEHRRSQPPPAGERMPAGEPDSSTSPGGFLRARREAAGLSLGEIADRTKISRTRLAQIEQEQHEHLPAPVYLRGFVISFARILGISDAEEVARRFLDHHRERVTEG